MHLPQRRVSSPLLISMLPDDHAKQRLTFQTQLGSENNDFCSACGGSGYLLCCDGCDRSFHFSCLDPPLNDDAKELDEPWYCFICVARKPLAAESPEKPQRGLFASLLNGLKKRNPATFLLPADIRDYYEGVQADRNGSFVEAVSSKPTRYVELQLASA